jgi:hypothetical protein
MDVRKLKAIAISIVDHVSINWKYFFCELQLKILVFRSETRADMCIPGGLLFMWGVVPNFWFCVSIATSQKNLVSVLRKWKKHFSWDETKCMLHMMIWISYLDPSHFSDQFRYIIYRIPIYKFVNMDYSILNKKENKLKFIYYYLNSRLLLFIHFCLLK